MGSKTTEGSNVSHSDDYLLSRGGMASARLTTQHFIHIHRQGWSIHPQIEGALASKKDIKICDLATGNGVWALNLSETYPDAEIVGLDMNTDQFPPSFTLPRNVSFHRYDILDPIPAEYQHHFDLVHIRLIVGGIYNKDKSLVISNIMSLLKPGGYIQWEEVKGNSIIVVDPSLKLDYTTPKSFFERVEKVTGFITACQWTVQIPDSLQENGFTNVQTYDPPINIEMLQHEKDCLMWSIDELINTIKGIPKPGVMEEMTRAAEELHQEYSRHEMWAYDWRVTFAQTPIAA